jgi:hypothetical protein
MSFKFTAYSFGFIKQVLEQVLDSVSFFLHIALSLLSFLVAFALVKFEKLFDAVVNFTDSFFSCQINSSANWSCFNLNHRVCVLSKNVQGCSKSCKDVSLVLRIHKGCCVGHDCCNIIIIQQV